MELSFSGVSNAEAVALAEELELALLKEGIPAKALKLRRASSENMDLGTILGVSVDSVLHAISAAGYIACFAKCIHEVVAMRNVTIRILNADGSVEIVGPKSEADLIAKAIAKSSKPRSKPKA